MFPVILFDVGGVLLTNGWDRGERAAAIAHFGLDDAEFERLHTLAYDAWERGSIDVAGYLDQTVFTEPRSFTQEEFYQFLLTGSKKLPDSALGILSELAASGKYLLGALNNEAREPNEYRFEHFGLSRYLVLRFTSCYLGLRKPEPEIFLRALDLLNRNADEVIFIDDRAENAAAALAVGMDAIQFVGAENLRAELKKRRAL
jgi:putative hydrolase of the HAD superfamily